MKQSLMWWCSFEVAASSSNFLRTHKLLKFSLLPLKLNPSTNKTMALGKPLAFLATVNMNKLKYLIAIAAVMGALTLSAKADLQFLGAVAFPGNNSPAANLAALEAFGVNTNGILLQNFENGLNGDQTISVTPGQFLVVHYGRGRGGSNPGGSWEFFRVINGETEVTVPGFGNVAGPDPFGHGGISSIRGFGGVGVPDGGTTVMLLGAGLGALGMVRRFLKI
jgi:hypothetical protein